MSEPKFQVGQAVIHMPSGRCPIVTAITGVLGFFVRGRYVSVPGIPGLCRWATASQWVYKTPESFYAGELDLFPITDPDTEYTEEQEREEVL
jgi:hypothetical protein